MVELVSPGNKGQAEKRTAFAAKCVADLTAGYGLLVVDVVTSRLSRPLDDLFPLLAAGVAVPEHGPLAAVSFRPTRAGEVDGIEVRALTLTVGGVLPELSPALDTGRVVPVPVDLEATYEDARGRSRLRGGMVGAGRKAEDGPGGQDQFDSGGVRRSNLRRDERRDGAR